MKGGTCDHDNNDPKISRNKQLIDAERPPNDDWKGGTEEYAGGQAETGRRTSRNMQAD